MIRVHLTNKISKHKIRKEIVCSHLCQPLPMLYLRHTVLVHSQNVRR